MKKNRQAFTGQGSVPVFIKYDDLKFAKDEKTPLKCTDYHLQVRIVVHGA